MQEWLLKTEVLVLKKYLEDKEEICHESTPSILGMVDKVKHLVTIVK